MRSLRTSVLTATIVAAVLTAPVLGAAVASRVSPATPATSATAPFADAPAAIGPGVQVRGAVRDPRRVTAAELAALPQQTVTVTYSSSGVPVTSTFSGPLLLDVLTLVQPRFDPNVKNDVLRFAVRALATDDYQAVVAWGELDPGFEAKQVLLATVEDGVALTRPRLVVPGDLKGGRFVSSVRVLTLLDLSA